MKRARELVVGDCFVLNVSGSVVATSRTTDGKRVRLTVQLDNRERRRGGEVLEFTNEVEFICRPGRPFQVFYRHDGDDLKDDCRALQERRFKDIHFGRIHRGPG